MAGMASAYFATLSWLSCACLEPCQLLVSVRLPAISGVRNGSLRSYLATGVCCRGWQDKVGDFSRFTSDKLLLETEKALSLESLYRSHMKLIELQESVSGAGEGGPPPIKSLGLGASKAAVPRGCFGMLSPLNRPRSVDSSWILVRARRCRPFRVCVLLTRRAGLRARGGG